MEQVDLIISPHLVLTLTAEKEGLVDHDVIIHQGRIKAILPRHLTPQHYQAKEHIQRPHHVLMPGFINMHSHVPMNLLRGLADDYPLMTWLNDHIWPAEGRFMGKDFIHDGTLLAIAEMIRSGTTCFNDSYFFSEIIAGTVLETGIRACVSCFVINFSSPYAKDPEAYFTQGLNLLQDFQGHERLQFSVAPHAIYSVPDPSLLRCKEMADQYHLPIHMHVQETKIEVEESLAKTGKRPLRRLHELGLLDDRFLAVHMTQVNDEDVELLKASRAHVIHCPQSNMKLASGICPITRLHHAGINIAIGTDSAASNNDLNMIEEMRAATLLAKVATQEATAIPAHTVLAMGTLHGAKALGLEKQLGSLEVGKAADMISINMDQLEMLPFYHPCSQLVYATNRENVNDVWVQGQALMQNRKLTTIDEEKLKATTKTWAKKIKAS